MSKPDSCIGNGYFYGGILNLDYGADVITSYLEVLEGNSGTINADDTSAFIGDTVTVPGTLTFNLTSTANITTNTISVAGTINVNDGSLLTMACRSTVGTLNVDGTDAEVLIQPSAVHIASLNISNGGLVTMAPRSGSANYLLVDSLNLGSPTSPTGALDLTDNDLIVDYTVQRRLAMSGH